MRQTPINHLRFLDENSNTGKDVLSLEEVPDTSNPDLCFFQDAGDKQWMTNCPTEGLGQVPVLTTFKLSS